MDINILQFPELLRRSVLVNAFIDARRESESCSKSVLHLDIAKFFKRVSDVPIFGVRVFDVSIFEPVGGGSGPRHGVRCLSWGPMSLTSK